MSENSHPTDRYADFTTDRRVILLSLMALVIGAIGTLVAVALLWLIYVFTNLFYFHKFSAANVPPAENHLGLWAILVPMVGGLIIGLMARYGSPKIRGHGIPEAIEAILIGRSKIEPKVALLKPLSSALSIGTGGPFGAEGPIIMTGGACGSLFAQMFHLSAAERKTLLVAGASAGMAAVFATPVAAVLLAVELLLFEWKPRSFIPVAVASATAAAMRVPFLGAGPIFSIPAHKPLAIEGLLFALLVGVLSGLGSSLLTVLVYFFEDLFMKFKFHWMWWPIIGGIVVGIGGVIDPRVLGVGYGVIHGLILGNVVGVALLSILIIKSVIWAAALGSGTSGGVLAPLLMIGGALGAMVGHWIPVGSPGLWAMIGMAAMMGGTMRAPLTAMIFAVELTYDFNMLLPLMVGCVAAQGVTVLLMRRSILTEKIARRGLHLSREYGVDVLETLRAGDVMDTAVATIASTMPVTELSESMSKGDLSLARRQGAVIVDADGRLAGIITLSDVLLAIEQHADSLVTVLDAGCQDLVVTYPDELLRDVVAKMLNNDIGRMPVVDREDEKKLLGYVDRAAVMAVRMRNYEEENDRETSIYLRPMRAPETAL